MSDGWHVSQNGRVLGPFTWEQALDFAREGWLGPHDLVMRLGSDEWVPVTDVPAFVAGTVQVTPPGNGEVVGEPAAPEAPVGTAPPRSAPRAHRRRLPAAAAIVALSIAGVAVGAPLAFDTGSSSDPSGGILFSRMRDGGQHIYVMGADGSNPRAITDSELADTHPSASPDGGRIVFVREEKGLMLLEAGGETQLTKDDALEPSGPVWSPDGERVFYSRLDSASEGASRYIYSMKADGTDDRRVSPAFPGGSGSDDDPSISPDGTTLAFVTTRPPEVGAMGWAIVEMPVDGGALTYVTGAAEKGSAGTGGPWHPTWSSEGSIVFTAETVGADGGGRDQIYVMNADGSGKTQVTSENDGDCQEPAWSPDGKRIVFARSSSGKGLSIWAIDAAGGNERALTEVNATDGDFSPSFLPETGALIAGPAGSGGGGSGGLGGRIGRIPGWWVERPAAVWSWVRIALVGGGSASGTEKGATEDDNPLLGAVKSLIEWAVGLGKGPTGGGNDYEYWSGETPETIYLVNIYGERAGRITGKPYMVRRLQRKTDGGMEVADLEFGISEYTCSALENPSNMPSPPPVPYPAPWADAVQRLNVKPGYIILTSLHDWSNVANADPERFVCFTSKGSEREEWEFRTEGSPGSEVFVVSLKYSGPVDTKRRWDRMYESGEDLFHMTRKY